LEHVGTVIFVVGGIVKEVQPQLPQLPSRHSHKLVRRKRQKYKAHVRTCIVSVAHRRTLWRFLLRRRGGSKRRATNWDGIRDSLSTSIPISVTVRRMCRSQWLGGRGNFCESSSIFNPLGLGFRSIQLFACKRAARGIMSLMWWNERGKKNKFTCKE